MLKLTLITPRGQVTDHGLTQKQVNNLITIYSNVFNTSSSDVNRIRFVVERED